MKDKVTDTATNHAANNVAPQSELDVTDTNESTNVEINVLTSNHPTTYGGTIEASHTNNTTTFVGENNNKSVMGHHDHVSVVYYVCSLLPKIDNFVLVCVLVLFVY